jgi:uncharacterized protein YraI
MKRLSCVFLVLATCFCTSAAWAGTAYTQGLVNLRAGPSRDYPKVDSIPPNTLLNVNGCLDDWTWCDVDWEGNRGWVYAKYLYYDYQDRRVPVLTFGASLGIGVVVFSIGDYWGRYYSTRPWYVRESYWMHRPPPPRNPYPPRPYPPRPPAHRPPPPPPRPHPPPKPRPPVTRPPPSTRPPTTAPPSTRPPPKPHPKPQPKPKPQPQPKPQPKPKPAPKPGPDQRPPPA